MADESLNGKRIAKNSLMLYFRMFLTMGVSLYTSRVILHALGINDYGIYNVVGGVVAMFGFINNSLGSASSRFITYAIGKSDQKEVQATFNSIVVIHYILAAIIFLLLETVGLWFVYNELVIPEERSNAAFWAYQSTVISSVFMIASVPYNSLIIAHERMTAFAYISIFEVSAKLLIALLLCTINSCDRLILYSVLLVLLQITIRIIYIMYSRKHFEESNYCLEWEPSRLKEIFSYAGWTMNGHLAVIGYTQGLNILLNLFFGLAVNAARAIAVQIQGAVQEFFTNFQIAVNPQITKSYAQGNLGYMHKLILTSSRFSYYLVLLISIPILFHIDYILHLWLVDVPDHTAHFVRIILLVCMVNTFKNPTIAAVYATGNIKRFQIIEGTMLLLIVPISYVLLKFFHTSPESVFLVYLIIEVLTQFVRIYIVYPMIKLSVNSFFSKVMLPCFLVTVLSVFIPCWVCYNISVNTFFRFAFVTVIYILSSCICIYFVGLSKIERKFINSKCSSLIYRFFV